MLALPRNSRITQVISLAVVVSGLFLVFLFRISISSAGSTISSYAGRDGRYRSSVRPANATLGFGGLYAVSGIGSPRRSHLEQAAAVTELDLTIPEQIEWTEEDIVRFRTENLTESKTGTGSIKAWLSHNLVLRAFLESGLETALVFEDDVDWDIHLRTLQIPLAQRAAQSLFKSTSFDASEYPWGTAMDWDLLWLGHCGDYFNTIDDGVGVGHHHPHQLAELEHVVFEDRSVPFYTDLHPWTASLLTAFRIPEQHRVIHESKWPLCTFGYVVTRKAAEKIITTIAPPKEDLSRNIHAYDVALLDACRDNKYLKCFSIQPELFHHMEGTSIIADVESAEHKVYRPPVDVKGEEQVLWRMETSNIGCGFWSGQFYYDHDTTKLEILREEVGRKGKCLKPGRE